MDIQTIDNNYNQLQSQAQQTVGELKELAAKLQTAMQAATRMRGNGSWTSKASRSPSRPSKIRSPTCSNPCTISSRPSKPLRSSNSRSPNRPHSKCPGATKTPATRRRATAITRRKTAPWAASSAACSTPASAAPSSPAPASASVTDLINKIF